MKVKLLKCGICSNWYLVSARLRCNVCGSEHIYDKLHHKHRYINLNGTEVVNGNYSYRPVENKFVED